MGISPAGGIGLLPAPEGPRGVATGGAARRRSRPTRNPWTRSPVLFPLAPAGAKVGAGTAMIRCRPTNASLPPCQRLLVGPHAAACHPAPDALSAHARIGRSCTSILHPAGVGDRMWCRAPRVSFACGSLHPWLRPFAPSGRDADLRSWSTRCVGQGEKGHELNGRRMVARLTACCHAVNPSYRAGRGSRARHLRA